MHGQGRKRAVFIANMMRGVVLVETLDFS